MLVFLSSLIHSNGEFFQLYSMRYQLHVDDSQTQTWMLDLSAVWYFHLALCYIAQNNSEFSDCSISFPLLPLSHSPKRQPHKWENHTNHSTLTEFMSFFFFFSNTLQLLRSKNFESLETFLFLSKSTYCLTGNHVKFIFKIYLTCNPFSSLLSP